MESWNKKLITGTALLFSVTAMGTIGLYVIGLFNCGVNWSIYECLYMTIITLTTVGFGEIIDVGSVTGARAFVIFILFCGLGVYAYCLSMLTAFLVEGEIKHIFWRKKMEKKIASLNGHIVLCGAGRVGGQILTELIKSKRKVVLIEESEDLVTKLYDTIGNFYAIIGDATTDQALKDAGIERAFGLIASLGDDKDNLCITVTVRQLNPDIRVISRCSDMAFAKKLQMLGAEAVLPNMIGALRMASQMVRPKVVRYLDVMLREKSNAFRIEELIVTKKSPLAGNDIDSIDFSRFGNLLLLAVMDKGGENIYYNPPPSYILKHGDILVFQTELEAFTRLKEWTK